MKFTKARSSPPQTPIHRKPRRRHLGCTFHVQDPQFRTKIPVRLRPKSKLPWTSPPPHLNVVVLTLPNRNVFISQVGNARKKIPKLKVKPVNLLVQLRDTVAQ